MNKNVFPDEIVQIAPWFDKNLIKPKNYTLRTLHANPHS